MKKLLLLALLVISFVAHSQTITIGEGTGMSTNVPYNSFYNYSYIEQLFLASEIQYAGYLTAISFRIAYDYNSEAVNDINVFVKNVSRNSFANTSDYEPVTAENLVFSGQWTIPANVDDWITITFDTPFHYNGTDNLLIAIDENSSDYAMRYFRYTDADARTLSFYSDTANPDPYDLDAYPGVQEVMDQRANIKLVFQYNFDMDENYSEELSVYPNPAKDMLYINGLEQTTEVSIYNTVGALVKVVNVSANEAINVGELPAGLYVARFGESNVRFTKE